MSQKSGNWKTRLLQACMLKKWEQTKGEWYLMMHPLLLFRIKEKKRNNTHLQRHLQVKWICICVYNSTDLFCSTRATPNKSSNLSAKMQQITLPPFPACLFLFFLFFFFFGIVYRKQLKPHNTSPRPQPVKSHSSSYLCFLRFTASTATATTVSPSHGWRRESC